METTANNISPVVFTNKAQCRDCYRCLRQCPVKAIRMINGQASVDPERCIACGTCIKECPQGAKQYRNDIEKAVRLLKEESPVAVSLAPSFAAFFTESERLRLPSALRKLGFSHIAETSVGAYPVAMASLKNKFSDKSSICTACPAAVSYIRKYVSELTENLLPVASPMLAHAAIIRNKLGEGAKVVFIGPCIAKKQEADTSSGPQKVDCALTFKELEEWFERENIRLDRLEESHFDDQPAGQARFFPLPGGLTRTAEIGSDSLAADIVAISGHDEFRKILATVKSTRARLFIEPLFCSQGCANGPGAPENYNLFKNRHEIIDYAETHKGLAQALSSTDTAVNAVYSPETIDAKETPVSEEEINRVLAATGKTSKADELNCGACGYNSCRDKAIAVIKGFAEIDMCIPYMRRLAEQRTDRIIETSPNGIVMLDDKLAIISMNPAFRKMFLCSEAVLGKHISYLIDPEAFEKVLTGSENLIEQTVKYSRYNLIAHQIIYQLEVENQLVGIFVNITGSRQSIAELARIRSKTVQQAREMLEHQVSMAQQMAKYLGESTAQGESLIENLLKLTEDESEDKNRRKGPEWDIFTSK
ncbi:MAG: [Fe-Fe] hydrogenase large subunit C-terminal domain-containing protein [Candidatus Riflebacteria bacterium]|jgi:iron only hydrogenase large subunit-like protein/uncharacterized Fe-S cluster-containing protein|nr:[Fe-Fe] hydrogenase large subunit C-terminal domain-containing protein [Candidatus Riflebacteria bacterium]